MNYRFAVQASNPRFVSTFDADAQSLSDAIQTVFPLETEYAIVVWNWVYVPLTYKYDISMMAEDLVNLIDLMLSNECGKQTIHWPSNTFAATWRVEWSNEVATVSADWDCVLGETEPILKNRPTIVLQTVEFVAEWKRPLEVVADALTAAGYTPQQLVGMRRLRDLVEKIDHCGTLYRDQAASCE